MNRAFLTLLIYFDVTIIHIMLLVITKNQFCCYMVSWVLKVVYLVTIIGYCVMYFYFLSNPFLWQCSSVVCKTQSRPHKMIYFQNGHGKFMIHEDHLQSYQTQIKKGGILVGCVCSGMKVIFPSWGKQIYTSIYMAWWKLLKRCQRRMTLIIEYNCIKFTTFGLLLFWPTVTTHER